jgi:hypothetical protein
MQRAFESAVIQLNVHQPRAIEMADGCTEVVVGPSSTGMPLFKFGLDQAHRTGKPVGAPQGCTARKDCVPCSPHATPSA